MNSIHFSPRRSLIELYVGIEERFSCLRQGARTIRRMAYEYNSFNVMMLIAE